MAENWKQKLHEVIFGTDTRAGRNFDIFLLWCILISVIAVVLESIPNLNVRYERLFFNIELFFTFIFTLEYILRIIISPKPLKYITSTWGIIDLLAILPFFLFLIAPQLRYFLVLRLFRMLRVFRILKLLRFLKESQFLFNALKSSAYKISVFIIAVITLVTLAGTTMYVVEGPENGYTSIPQSIYWTIVTITTVGYGDITPQTHIGKVIASIIMLCGYAIIAIPTGIVTVEMSRSREAKTKACTNCGHVNADEAKFCSNCGVPLAI